MPSRRPAFHVPLALSLLALGLAFAAVACEGSRITEGNSSLRFDVGNGDGWKSRDGEDDGGGDTADAIRDAIGDAVGDGGPADVDRRDTDIKRDDVTGPPCVDDRDCAAAFADLGPCEQAFCQVPPGVCVRLPKVDGADCDDLCSTGGACQAGLCVGGAPRSCSDGIECTVDDCDPDMGCAHSPQDALCDDEDVCTEDHCVAASGCVYSEIPACRCEGDGDCDDIEPCTTDKCGDDNVCDHVPKPDETACEDGNDCTERDHCVAGVCRPGPDTCPTSEICGDGLDNDGDGLADCDDDDCAGALGCGAACDVDLVVTCDAILRGNTSGDDNTYSGYGCSGWTESGPDRVVGFQHATGGDVALALLTPWGGADLDLFLLDASCDPGSGCLEAGNHSIVFDARAGAPYYVVVDGWDGQSGPFTLVVDCLGDNEGNCGNGQDDDGDGHTDCDDADCASALACGERDCVDGLDNDGDGETDCADSDCGNSLACEEGCTDATPVTCDARLTGTTAGAGNTFSGYGCTAWDESGPDRIWALRPETAGSVVVTLESLDGGVDHDLFLLDGTCDPGAGCLDYANESLAFDALPDTTYYVVLDGWSGQAGGFLLTVDCFGGAQETDCANGRDDDSDGHVDCADADCVGSADCSEKDCRDGRDGDGDGLVDCDDPDCEGDRACIQAICNVDEVIGCDAFVRRTTVGDGNTYQGYGCTAWDESGRDHIFGFQTDTAGPVQVTLLYTDPGVDLDIFLLDATCDPGSGCILSDDETYAFLAEPGVTYYLVVDGWGGQAGPYSLSVDCLLGQREQQCNDGADNDGDGYADCEDADCADALNCAICSHDDAFEDDDGTAGANPAGAGATFEGMIARSGDPDWYAVNVCRGATVTAQAFYDAEEGDIAVELYRLDGATQVARAAGAGGSAVARWDADVDGTAYVRVAPPSAGCTGYTLQIGVNSVGCAQPLEVCDNGVDDDGDRATDCADPDCAGAPQCLVCTEDNREPNDTAATANNVGDAQILGGLIAAPGDDDWYRVSVCAGGGLQVTSSYTNGGVALELWNASGTLKLDESRFTGGTERVAVVAPAGDVLVRVVGASGFCTRYELVFQETCGNLCSDPIYEPNDTRGQAEDVSPGGALTSIRLGAGDEDWFSLRVNICDSPVVAAVADWDPLKGDVNLELYDASGTLLQAADSPRGSSASLAVPASGGAWYYLRVTGHGNICLPYALSFIGQCPPACGQMDLYEPNDTRASAWGNGSTGWFSSLALSPGDEDWFWYTTCAGGVAVVTATTTVGDGDLDLELFDASGNRLDVSEGTTEVETVAAVTGYSGRVYARVYSARPQETCLRYELALDRDCQDVCTDDLYEQNDTPGSAADAGAGGYYSSLKAATNDDDWFKVHVCAGGTLTVTSAYNAAGGEVDLELYDKTGTRLLSGAYGLTGAESITWQSPNPDTLLVRAFGPGAVCTSYDLRIETGACGGVIVGPGETCGPDPYEQDDNAQTAANAGSGGAYQSLTAEPSDPDWFRVRVCAGGTLTATATWDGATAGSVDLAVFAQDGTTQLGSGQGAGGRATATTTSQGQADLLVRASLRGSACLPYRLDLLVAGCGGTTACGPDAFEEDDRRETANAAGAGGSWPTLTGKAGDPDWFSVELCPAGVVTATARALGEGDPVGLRLVRSNGTSTLDSDTGLAGTASVTASPGDESVVYVVAEGAGGCRPYALDIERTGCGGVGCASDPSEPNDTAASATDAGGGANLRGLTIETGSPDWFAVQVCAGGALVATSTHTPQLGDLDLFLYASDGGTLIDSSQGLAGTEQVTFASSGEPTTVYVQVRGIAGDCVPYTLDLLVDGCGGGACFDDVREDNDAPWEATQAGGGQSYLDVTAAPGDEDWYAVQVCAGGFVYATAMVNPADGDVGLRLYGGDGATVLDSGAASAGTATVTGSSTLAGTLYVRVLAVGEACVPYTVDITVDGCAGECTDDGWEENDTAAAAVDAGSGQTFTNQVAVGGDADWFRLLACADGRAEATVTYAPADGEVQLELYRANGTLVLVSGQGGGGTLTASAQLPAGETVAYARVEARGAASCVPYQLVLGASGCGGSCTDDALEDNDRAATASDLGGATSVGGLRAVGGDDDWYSVPTCAGGTLTATVTFDANAGDVNVYLFANDTTTELDSSTTAGGVETVSVTTSLQTTFYVKVIAAGNACVTYRIETAISGCGGGCVDDAAEDDDSPATAATYEQGGTFERVAVRGDRDWFAVPLCSGGNVRLRATFDANTADIDMRLYAADGSTVLDASSGASGQETVEHASASATVVYAEVYVTAGTCAPYSLEITIENCALGCTDDGAEPDDGVASARSVTPGATLRNRVLAQNDPDWVSVDVCAGGTVTVSVTYTGGDGQLGVDLYDADAFTLLRTTGGAGGAAQVTATVDSGGARYVKVFPSGAVCIPYEMTVTVTGCSDCTDDRLEPNDGPAGATSAPGGGAFQDLVARPMDADWFSVPVCAGGRLTGTLTYDPTAGNVGLRIYGSDGVTPVATSASGDGAENASYTNPLGASTLYVRVMEQGDEASGACATYDLQLVIAGCGGGCTDDAQEDNDGPGQAVNLGAAGGTFPSLVAASGDADWFRVSVCTGGRLVADATYAAADGTLGLAVFDRTGGSLLTSDARGGGTAHVAQDNATGAPVEWHVSAYALGEACLDYGLTVGVEGCGQACVDDDLEDDDTVGTATPVPSGGLTRTLVADDADWFAVQVCAGGTVRANVGFETGASTLDLRVYAADGTTALATDTGSDGSLAAQALTSEAGTVFVRVRDEDVGCTPYSVQISVSGCGFCPDDAFEDDDDSTRANTAGTGSVSGHIAAPGDPDWFAVRVCAGGTLSVQAVWDGVNGDLDLGLFDRDGAALLASTPGTGGVATVTTANPHAEEATLYLRVSAVGTNCLPYLLEFTLQGCAAACPPDELEENDGPEVATAVPTSGPGGGSGTWDTLSLSPDDADWFEVPVCAGGTLVADALFLHADGNLNLRLYASDGFSILASATSWDDDEHLVWNAPAAAAVTTYLRAYVTTAGACVLYDLDISVLCN